MMAATQIPNDLKMGREYALLGKYVNALPSYACSFPVLSSCLVWVIVWVIVYMLSSFPYLD